jgi:hypothetical protein
MTGTESESAQLALSRQAEVNELLGKATYAGTDRARILELLTELGLRDSDDGSELVVLRQLRGQLLRRRANGEVTVVADGRAGWVGQVELRDTSLGSSSSSEAKSSLPLRLRLLEVHHRWRGRLRWFMGAVGTAVLCAGVVVLFTTDKDARSAFLVTVGVALMLYALLGRRVQLDGFEILGAQVRVKEVDKRRLELAESPEAGRQVDAAALRRQAAMLQRLTGAYGLYEHIRRSEPPGPRRTQALDQLAVRMQQAGQDAEFNVAEVIGWFHEGTDPLRVIALNLMLANEQYRDLLTVLETLDAPHSLFEQFYGLLLAEAMLPGLDDLERRLLRDAVLRAQRKRRFRRDDWLPGLSEQLLDRLDEEAAISGSTLSTSRSHPQPA